MSNRNRFRPLAGAGGSMTARSLAVRFMAMNGRCTRIAAAARCCVILEKRELWTSVRNSQGFQEKCGQIRITVVAEGMLVFGVGRMKHSIMRRNEIVWLQSRVRVLRSVASRTPEYPGCGHVTSPGSLADAQRTQERYCRTGKGGGCISGDPAHAHIDE